MVVEAEGWSEAKQMSERILWHEGIKAMAVEAEELHRRQKQ